MVDDPIKKLQVIVTRHAKQMLYTYLLQTGQQVISNSECGHCAILSGKSWVKYLTADEISEECRTFRQPQWLESRRYAGGIFCKNTNCCALSLSVTVYTDRLLAHIPVFTQER
ncbi:hypothetical protein ACJ2_02180 [Pantoea sp. QMID2]|nr:hypothetical protein ACJ3_02190 [Pantoea sp. QMID3]GME29871.1 hypothetical protein ACJ1_02180 [Pantoea sp. QMID1]GME49465.1 hypothetical protein ACJ4_02190 [Pantoea sp. QMID4]GME50596.1 hypothetical protein ACJ2_02180 [Pantoea sp. QMID2]